jgi:hypothetical protein
MSSISRTVLDLHQRLSAHDVRASALLYEGARQLWAEPSSQGVPVVIRSLDSAEIRRDHDELMLGKASCKEFCEKAMCFQVFRLAAERVLAGRFVVQHVRRRSGQRNDFRGIMGCACVGTLPPRRSQKTAHASPSTRIVPAPPLWLRRCCQHSVSPPPTFGRLRDVPVEKLMIPKHQVVLRHMLTGGKHLLSFQPT